LFVCFKLIFEPAGVEAFVRSFSPPVAAKLHSFLLV